MNLVPDDIDWSEYERSTQDEAKVRPAEAYLTAMIEGIGHPEAQERECYLPWAKTHKLFALRDGETTLWAGYGGHGKSEVTGMCISSLMVQGESACIASLEMKPKATLWRMLRQFGALGQAAPDSQQREMADEFRLLCDKRLWMYDHQGVLSPKRAVAVARYCFRELGVNHFVLDSLMKCVRGEDDYNGQKDLVDELTSLARDEGKHLHLIHHLRKGDRELDPPDRNDIKGSGSIVDQVDNVLLCFRNKRKEMDIAAEKNVANDVPDNLLLVKKQRSGTGWEGTIKLFHDPVTKQYTSTPQAVMNMAAWPHVETIRRWS